MIGWQKQGNLVVTDHTWFLSSGEEEEEDEVSELEFTDGSDDEDEDEEEDSDGGSGSSSEDDERIQEVYDDEQELDEKDVIVDSDGSDEGDESEGEDRIMINPKLKAKNEAASEDDEEEEVSKQVWPPTPNVNNFSKFLWELNSFLTTPTTSELLNFEKWPHVALRKPKFGEEISPVLSSST